MPRKGGGGGGHALVPGQMVNAVIENDLLLAVLIDWSLFFSQRPARGRGEQNTPYPFH